MNTCLVCGKRLKRPAYKYCSNRCQSIHRYNTYIEQWKLGLVNGNRGVNTKNISAHVKRYLSIKFGERCMLCGWSRKNPITGKTALEVDHLNGNSEDNQEDNLRLLCPNCHSLSPNYKNLNRGKGRTWRTTKYLKNKSVNY